MNSKMLKGAFTGLVLSISGFANAGLIEIDFDNLSSGTIVGANYISQGVEFVDATIVSIGLPGMSAPNGINRLGDYQFFQDNPIVAIFSDLISSVSLTGYDVGANGFIMKAFDAQVGGNLLQSISFVGPGVGVGTNHLLTLDVGGIRRVEFSQISSVTGDGVVFDDFSFTTKAIPEPTTIAIFALGIMGLAARRFNASK